jgi:hypothetical protein
MMDRITVSLVPKLKYTGPGAWIELIKKLSLAQVSIPENTLKEDPSCK